MQEQHTWRTLLGSIIRDSQERQRLAHDLNVSPITLTRWASGEAKPRSQNVTQLLKSLPRQRKLLYTLLIEEFPEFAIDKEIDEDEPLHIPSEFYTRILEAYKATSRQQRLWSLGNLVLQQMLNQMDTNQAGMAITLAQCMPATQQNNFKVCSLRERMGRGSSPWNPILDDKLMFLGIESLAGYSITSNRLVTIQNQEERHGRFPAQWIDWEVSAAACPIMLEGNIAGALIVSSTLPDFFTSSRQKIIQHYADLLTLLFRENEFYEQKDIALHVMPSYEIQQKHLTDLRRRISDLMRTSNQQSTQKINVVQAELMVWQQIEGELLRIPVVVEG